MNEGCSTFDTDDLALASSQALCLRVMTSTVHSAAARTAYGCFDAVTLERLFAKVFGAGSHREQQRQAAAGAVLPSYCTHKGFKISLKASELQNTFQ